MMSRTQSHLRIPEKRAYQRRFVADSDHTFRLDAIALGFSTLSLTPRCIEPPQLFSSLLDHMWQQR